MALQTKVLAILKVSACLLSINGVSDNVAVSVDKGKEAKDVQAFYENLGALALGKG